jgi:endoglucanase
VDVADGKFAESDLTAPGDITPVDVFPPAVPTGLRADAAPASIELVWDRNTESDLAGYRIYRSSGDGPLERLAESNEIPSYSDRAVEHGKTYHYAITSFDRSTPPNESAPSARVEATFQ